MERSIRFSHAEQIPMLPLSPIMAPSFPSTPSRKTRRPLRCRPLGLGQAHRFLPGRTIKQSSSLLQHLPAPTCFFGESSLTARASTKAPGSFFVGTVSNGMRLAMQIIRSCHTLSHMPCIRLYLHHSARQARILREFLEREV